MKTYIVDSFTRVPFKGNPAGVCFFDEPLTDALMQNIARELRHSETAFVKENSPGEFSIRYFSPVTEIPLCGHATLAASRVIFSASCDRIGGIVFTTGEGLKLKVRMEADELIVMQFPVYETEPAEAPAALLSALGVCQVENSAYNKETGIMLLEIEGTNVLAELKPDFQKLLQSHDGIRGVLVTARSRDGEFDFHSRYFWPWSGGEEDPVTGGTHTFLAKYWSDRIGKTELRSFQASRRSGQMTVELTSDKVLLIKSHAVIVFEGNWLPKVQPVAHSVGLVYETQHPNAENDTIRFRPTQLGDLDFVLSSENAPDNAPHIVNWTRQQHEAAIADEDVEHWLIESPEPRCRPVGYLISRGWKQSNGPIELKRLVVTEKRQGFGRAALRLLKWLVLKERCRPRLWLNVLPGNIRAKLLYQSVGFRYEGTWHDSFETENGFCDLELLTVLATDDFEPKSFTVGGDDFSAERSLSQHQFSQLLELMQKEWPNDTRTVEDMINAVLGSEFVIALNHIESGDLIGFCRVISDRGFRAWISGVVVRKDFRGRGLGRKLIDVVLTAPELSGIHSVSLTCAPAMIPFYTKWGFEIHEDELVMNLPLRR